MENQSSSPPAPRDASTNGAGSNDSAATAAAAAAKAALVASVAQQAIEKHLQPPLGRHASAGDSQPALVKRQDSLTSARKETQPMGIDKQEPKRTPLPKGPRIKQERTSDSKSPKTRLPIAAATEPPISASSASKMARPIFSPHFPKATGASPAAPPAALGQSPRAYLDMPSQQPAMGGPSGLRPPASLHGAAAPGGTMPKELSPAPRHPAENAGPPAARQAPPPAPAPAPAPSPPPAARPPPGPPVMRELRVEDALLYLDDVKREFGDRPRVYNEFLAIMKNFKSQEVDTPGVIARVSKLFRGYNNLILGFNKFLPDGYKISLKDLEDQERTWARDEAAAAAAARAVQSGQGLQNQGNIAPPPAAPPAPTPPPAPPAPPPAMAPQRVALPPQKAAEPPRRSPESMLGAARPVPKAREPAIAQSMAARPPVQYKMQVTPQPQAPAPVSAPQPHRPPAMAPRAAPAPPVAPAQPPAPAPAASPQHQAVEFDHAISYVTTIKRRFASDPSTYHAFLEILHTYQKEQRGIKEVLEQVAHLFQDHPDLLKEFTFFLPDAVQEQAKERLHRAAAESESRQAAQRAQLEQQRKTAAEEPAEAPESDSKAQQKFIDMSMTDAEPAPRNRKRAHKEVQEPQIPVQIPQQPESYVYNSAVERQFFDAAKEALASFTRDGGQAWAEFLKCLDMYAQEILSRSEMLNFVEPLLGKRNNKLFEEFKRIISSAGAQAGNQPSMEDSWYSVPLSEIDFSRCRRCSPSYRALPRDYPAPPCSERSEFECKVLNDVWVSLPVGSEESYTFRHMRRNACEETLFRCEDERFEIDMIIDSNSLTLGLLEPIAEEIAQLAENELVISETSSVPRPASTDQGMGGKRFHYTFEKSILKVIHRNSITRMYGDAGQEMLELISKNPTVAIPVVVERLRQKDKQWRVVRDRLNRKWRELAEHNYYKSLDHRSLTWRTTDKRAISTRTLVSEIRDRAANGGKEGAASLQARMDKAKEEHGAFYETTMGNSLKKTLDLTNLPKPDRRLFTPHMSLMYENTSWVQRDAYRLLSFALERGSISPSDKERCHRLWFDFLGPLFNLSVDWMMTPAVKYVEACKPAVSPKDMARVVSNGHDSPVDDEEESLDDDVGARVVTEEARKIRPTDRDGKPSYMDHHPLPRGATVSTIYGEGIVLACRKSDDTYVVRFPFGKAFLRPSAILCSILSAEKSAYTSQLRKEDRTKMERPGDMLAVGTQSLYLFFRLHQILVRRLGIAKQLAYSIKENGALINMVEQMPGEDAAALGKRRYDAFLSLVYAVLDGGVPPTDGAKYEDRVRFLLGHGGYELATLDRLIPHLLKNLQTMANDDTMWNLIQLFRRHMDAGSFKPEAFRQEAGYLSDGEAMYAFQLCPVQKGVVSGENKSVLHIEYLGNISESENEVPAVEPLSSTSHNHHHHQQQHHKQEPTVKRQKRER